MCSGHRADVLYPRATLIFLLFPAITTGCRWLVKRGCVDDHVEIYCLLFWTIQVRLRPALLVQLRCSATGVEQAGRRETDGLELARVHRVDGGGGVGGMALGQRQ